MSRLEAQAIAPLVPLIKGDVFDLTNSLAQYMLNARGQRTIATFLSLVTMRVEFTHPPTQAATAIDRILLKERCEPPPNWQVWIARYVGDTPDEHWCRHYGLQLVSSPDEAVGPPKCDTQATTFVIGQLCAHVFSSTSMPDFEGYTGATLCRIWPLTGWDVDCRILPTISDRGVLSLSEALAREIPPIIDRT